RNDKGEEVARVEAPAGTSVEVRPAATKPTPPVPLAKVGVAKASIPRTPLADGPPGELAAIPLAGNGRGMGASRDGRAVGICDAYDRAAKWIELATGRVLWRWPATDTPNFASDMLGALSPDGKLWAFGAIRGSRHSIELLRTENGSFVQTIPADGTVN